MSKTIHVIVFDAVGNMSNSLVSSKDCATVVDVQATSDDSEMRFYFRLDIYA